MDYEEREKEGESPGRKEIQGEIAHRGKRGNGWKRNFPLLLVTFSEVPFILQVL